MMGVLRLLGFTSLTCVLLFTLQHQWKIHELLIDAIPTMVPDPFTFVAASVGLFQNCVTALVLIGKATTYERKVQDAQCRTDLLLHDLATWAHAAGLLMRPPTLRVDIEDAPKIPMILEQLKSLFDDLTKLKRYGNLHLDRDDGNTNAVDEDRLIVTQVSLERSTWERFDIRPFLGKLKPFKRLRWVVYDDEKFNILLKNAREYVSHLEKYLDPTRQERLGTMREFHLMNLILNADERQSGIIGEANRHAVSAAAKLRQSRLTLGLRNDPAQSFQPFHGIDLVGSMRLTKQSLKLSPDHIYTSIRSLERYDGNVVLLEWKYVEDMNIPGIKTRVTQVAALLNVNGASMHSLQCRGFVEDNRYKRYGYVFELPQEVISASGTQLMSLRSMLEQPAPSLNARLSLAVKLLETILGTHTSGWLHKEVRSENIILLRKGSSYSDDFSSWSVFVTGFVYSRLDHPDEMTEPLNSEFRADLYRHPALLADARRPFRKAFDIFSVGCTLLEIGLWKPLHQILVQHAPPGLIMQDSSRPVEDQSHSVELAAIKRELLCSYAPSNNLKQNTSSLPANHLLRSLESVVGKKYTKVVRELLANCNAPELNENENILDLEMAARDTVRSIAANV